MNEYANIRTVLRISLGVIELQTLILISFYYYLKYFVNIFLYRVRGRVLSARISARKAKKMDSLESTLFIYI